MKNYVSLILAAGLLFSSAASALAHDTSAGALVVDHPWARASAGPVRNGAAFLVIHNSGEADRLIAASAEVAERLELHSHIMENDVMKMRRVEAVDVPAGGAATLQPGGLHIMMFGLAAPLKEGERFPLTLIFEKAGSITVEVVVEGVASMGAARAPETMNSGTTGHGTMDHGTMAPAN